MSLLKQLPRIDPGLGKSLQSYWKERLYQHNFDSYMGIPMLKFPEDLRTYEHLLWETRADVVIELGSLHGGSALWFRDRLDALSKTGRIRKRDGRFPSVISVDIDCQPSRTNLQKVDVKFASDIELVQGSVTDANLPTTIASKIAPGARCFVVEDTAHNSETTTGSLENYSRFVPVGGVFVVEDGSVDVEDLRIMPEWPRGVLPALDRWLATPKGKRFQVDRTLELYGVTCHPRGFLKRIS